MTVLQKDSLMSNKIKFLDKFKELLLKARNEYSDFIDELPINEDRNNSDRYSKLTNAGFIIRFPFRGLKNLSKDDYNSKVRKIGEEILTNLLNEFKSDITVDLKGHNRSEGCVSLNESSKTNDYTDISVESIVKSLGFKIGVNATSLPKKISDNLDLESIITSIYDVFDFDYEDKLIISSDSSLLCTCCGDELRPLLDLNTLKISLYPAFDLLSSSRNTPTEPRYCPYPKGVGSYTNTIRTPSKKIVIANDLRSILSQSEVDGNEYIASKFSSYNSISTCQLANIYNTEFYLKFHNMMYIQTGSGGISLFQDETNLTIEGKHDFYFDLKSNLERKNWNEGEKNIGFIGFSLWALCAMDYKQFIHLCEKNKSNIEDILESLNAIVVDVKNDVTKFTSHYFSRGEHHEKLFLIE